MPAEKLCPAPTHLLHGLFVVSEILQLPLGPFRQLLEDLLPPGGGLGRRDGQGQCLHGGRQACGRPEPQGQMSGPPTAGQQARVLFLFLRQPFLARKL